MGPMRQEVRTGCVTRAAARRTCHCTFTQRTTAPSPILFSPIHLAFVPLLLVLARVAYVQGKRLLGSTSRNDKHMSIFVKWGRERLRFALPAPATKLSDLRHEIAEYTHLPEQSFKLIHAGAVMKDDNAPISAYGIKPGSTIALVGGGDPIKPPSSKASSAQEKAPRTEASIITQIRTELDKVRSTLQPDVDTFLSALAPAGAAARVGAEPTATAPAPKPASSAAGSGTRPPLSSEQEHTRLGELLLQSLLRLDAITAEGEWEVARRERKVAVKEVQALLDRLDGGWRARARS